MFHTLGHFYDSSDEDALWGLMNGSIRRKLKIIPKTVTWGGKYFIILMFDLRSRAYFK